MRSLDEVKLAFQSQKIGEGERMRLLKIEKTFIDLADEMLEFCPENADRTAAFRLLLQAKWTFVQSVTHHKNPAPKKAAKEGDSDEAQLRKA